MKTQKRRNRKKLFLIMLFIIGFLVTIYPTVSNIYYRQVQTEQINEFIKGKEEIEDLELKRKMELARQYNNTLDPSRLADPYTEDEKEGIVEYARMLEVEEKIGFVEIPKIGENLPVYAGTSDSILERGSGHLEGTSLPIGGESTHSVLTAHRGLPKAKLFRDLDELEIGDVFYFHNIETVLAYEVDQIITVEPWDFEPVLVSAGEDLMTLLSCTPYMINSHRLLVRGHRVDYVPPVDEFEEVNKNVDNWYGEILHYIVLLLIILIVIAIYNFYSYKRAQEKLKRKQTDEEE